MNLKAIILVSLSLSFVNPLKAQVLKNILGTSNSSSIPTNESMIQNLRADVLELTHSKYSNRALGTIGFKNVTAHLERRMQQLGLLRYGTIGFRSVYKYPSGKARTVETKFYIGDKSLFIGTDVIPVSFAAIEDNAAHFIPNVNEPYAPWTLPLPSGTLTEQNMLKVLKPLVLNAQDRGATALYFYDNGLSGNLDFKNLESKDPETEEDITIPVWIISKKTWDEHFRKMLSVVYVNSMPRYKIKFEDGYNVIGLIDNKAPKTIVVMADYDQLFPENENSNGANRNASGVAGMMQLAHIFKGSEYKSYNYAFAAFSGSKTGGLGAKSFLSIPDIKSKLAYVIDMTAIGKMNGNNEIFINGLNTSTNFKNAIKSVSPNFEPKVGSEYPYEASYTQFIEQEVPTLSFSTGFSKDILKQSDEVSGLNFIGMAQSVRFAAMVVAKLNEGAAPIFAKRAFEVKNEDLVVQKVVAKVVEKPKPTTTKTAQPTITKTTQPKITKTTQPSTNQKLAQAKNNLKNNQNSKPNNSKIVKPTTTPKLPVEETFNGESNIVVDILGLGINELDIREGGAIVQSVSEDSKAAKLGIKSGDILLQIGSFPVFNAKSYLLTLQKFKEGERAYYKVKKKEDGKTVMINVEF